MGTPLAIVRSLLEAEEETPPSPLTFDPKQFVLGAAQQAQILPGVPDPTTYFRVQSKLRGNFRNKTQRKVGNHTYLVQESVSGFIGLRFWYTYVIRFYDDRCVVNNGHYYTVTTRARINEWLPCGWDIYTHQSMWYWMNRSTGIGSDWGRLSYHRYPYSNGDWIEYATGELHTQSPPEPTRIRASTIARRLEQERRWREQYPQYYQ